MNQKARALLRKITFLFTLLGFIDFLVAYGLPHWAKYTSAAGQIHRYGLFMTCIEDFIKSECDTFHIESVDGKTSLLWRFHFILSDFTLEKTLKHMHLWRSLYLTQIQWFMYHILSARTIFFFSVKIGHTILMPSEGRKLYNTNYVCIHVLSDIFFVYFYMVHV